MPNVSERKISRPFQIKKEVSHLKIQLIFKVNNPQSLVQVQGHQKIALLDPYNFYSGHFLRKCVLLEIIGGSHSFQIPCIMVKDVHGYKT